VTEDDQTPDDENRPPSDGETTRIPRPPQSPPQLDTDRSRDRPGPDDQTAHVHLPPPRPTHADTARLKNDQVTNVPWWQDIYQRSPSEQHDDRLRALDQPPQPNRPKPSLPSVLRAPHLPPHQSDSPQWYQRPPKRSAPPVSPQTPFADRSHAPIPPRPEAPPYASEAPRRWSLKRRRVLIIGGIAIVAIEAIALVSILSVLGAGGTKQLDVAEVDAGVAQVLTDTVDGYGAKSVLNVRCNDGNNPEAKKASTFTCQASVNGAQRQITAVIIDDDGTYEIDWPR
jgi:hypothetical protein